MVVEEAEVTAPRGRGRQGGQRTERPWYEKFSKLCQLAGKPVQVHTSHNTMNCKPLYTALRSIYTADFEDTEYDAEGDEEFEADEATTLEEEPHGS